jgi:hypothetical protein
MPTNSQSAKPVELTAHSMRICNTSFCAKIPIVIADGLQRNVAVKHGAYDISDRRSGNNSRHVDVYQLNPVATQPADREQRLGRALRTT